MIKLKTSAQIEQMRQAGRVVHGVLARLSEMARPGVTTGELDAEAARMLAQAGADGLFKDYPNHRVGGRPFPGYICASLNEQVVHGIPGPRAIRDGDILSVDFGARLDGWCGDAAVTLMVGQVPPKAARLVEVTRETLDLAIQMIRPGRMWSQIAKAMQRHVESAGFSVVTEYVGHGIGSEMHEAPKVPNFWARIWANEDFQLAEGMTLAIEPMVNAGRSDVTGADDDWTIVSRDRQPSAHFEHTVAVRPGGADVLTDGR
ncbi:MAG: type I methionyl aminopeptidase [Phycisphaerae bacterium]|nr:type I methionyl aminopeptidase [Phycisphaerae bacterium]